MCTYNAISSHTDHFEIQKRDSEESLLTFVNLFPVADPGPLMLGVLDRWTPTVNILQTQIAQISFHIELCPIEARYSISLYTTPLSIWLSGFGDFFFNLFCLKKQMSPARDQFEPQVRGCVNV